MPSRLETYRVEAYNTAKQSENKMHDDTVARRFGFIGGLVPGVDVLAYMMHVPVAQWGRDFLERGLIDARFIKPVYDGEIADVNARRTTACSRSGLQPRRALRHRHGVVAGGCACVFVGDFVEVAAVAERKPVNAASYEIGKWLGTAPRRWAGRGGQRISRRHPRNRSDLAREGSAIPA